MSPLFRGLDEAAVVCSRGLCGWGVGWGFIVRSDVFPCHGNCEYNNEEYDDRYHEKSSADFFQYFHGLSLMVVFPVELV